MNWRADIQKNSTTQLLQRIVRRMYTDIIIQILYRRLSDSTEQDGALKVNDSIFKNSACFTAFPVNSWSLLKVKGLGSKLMSRSEGKNSRSSARFQMEFLPPYMVLSFGLHKNNLLHCFVSSYQVHGWQLLHTKTNTKFIMWNQNSTKEAFNMMFWNIQLANNKVQVWVLFLLFLKWDAPIASHGFCWPF